MATSLLYLGPCLGPCSTLVTAGSGGVCVCSCCGCCGCCGVAGAAIGVAGGAAIGTTCGTAVGIASGIGGAAGGISGAFYGASCGASCGAYYWWVGMSFIDLACCAGCLGVVGVREDVLVLKLNRVENL